MSEVWNVHPNVGIGPLRFGMTHAQVAEFQTVMGPLAETTEETLPDGSTSLNEFRDSGEATCSFQGGVLISVSISEFTAVDVRFQGVSIFKDDPKHVYSTLGRAAGAVYWCHNRVAMPSLGLELIGFVMEYSDKGKPPIFRNKRTGFTWPAVRLFAPGMDYYYKHSKPIEISNEAS